MQTMLYAASWEWDNDLNVYPDSYGRGQPVAGDIIFQSTGTTVTMTCNSSKQPPAATIVEPDMVCLNNLILHGVDHLLWPY
jgi:hypothetical protein